MILWFTGQPGSGKTTIANYIHSLQILSSSIIIDGDEMRELFDNTDYSTEGRKRNIEEVQKLAKFLNHKGFTPLVAVVSPYRDTREKFKKEMGKSLTEFFVHTDEKRGREHFFVEGYESPLENFIDIDTTNTTIEDAVKKVMESYEKI